MAKISISDKMRMKTLHEQGLGAKAIRSAYPDRKWSLTSIKRICKMIDTTGSALERKPGSGRPKTVRTTENIARVEELICSQEDKPGTSKSTRQVAREIGISQTSVRRIAKADIGLSSFKRMPVQVISEATRLKRLQRSKQLLRRLTQQRVKSIFFTDEKIFHLSPPVNTQNNRVWSTGRKRDVKPERLLVQRAKFSTHVMVSAGVCYGGKGRLHFVDEKAKINTQYYINNLLPKLFDDSRELLTNQFIFQQDGAPAHTSRQTQEWITQNSPDFISKNEWPPNSPDLNPLDYHVWGAMLHKYQQLSPKPANKEQLKHALQTIWDELPQDSINKAVLAFRKRLRACVAVDGKHFENFLC
jgi:inhibitor of nuclear factor kappa-B kinase subunit alpha